MNCSLGTGDIDLVIHLNWWTTDNAEKLQAALNSQGLEKIRTFGHLNSVGYQEAWAKDDITVRLLKSKSLAPHFLKVDLFSGTFSENKNKVFTSLWIQGEPSTCSYPVKSIRKWPSLFITYLYTYCIQAVQVVGQCECECSLPGI